MSIERVPILMYHRIGEAKNDWERKYCIGARQFEAHMTILARAGWRPLSLAEFFRWIDGAVDIDERAFLLTFDDGFLGVHEHAGPILRELKWPATVFLVSALLGERDQWSASSNPSGTTHPLMNANHIEDLRKQHVSFQSHTRTHADLPTLNDAALCDQLAGSRTDLEALLGQPVEYLAYPYGRLDDRVCAAAKEAGYRAAFSVQPGFNRRDVDRFRLRRLDVFGTDSASALMRKITLGSNDGSIGHAVKYAVSRVAARLGSRQDPRSGGGA